VTAAIDHAAEHRRAAAIRAFWARFGLRVYVVPDEQIPGCTCYSNLMQVLRPSVPPGITPLAELRRLWQALEALK